MHVSPLEGGVPHTCSLALGVFACVFLCKCMVCVCNQAAIMCVYQLYSLTEKACVCVRVCVCGLGGGGHTFFMETKHKAP